MSILDKARNQKGSSEKVVPETTAKPKVERDINKIIEDGVDKDAMEVQARDLNQFIAGGIKPPEPPKKGELMHCLYCSDPMPPESFPKSKLMRRYMFKWHICESCVDKAHQILDKNTEGIIRERS